MAVPVEDLIALRDGLIRARASGIRSTYYQGNRVEYASDPEMASAIADLDRRISQATALHRGVSVKFSTSKGL